MRPFQGSWLAVAGALLALLSVAAGAFGAHALADAVTPQRLAVFETAARYQMYHALALFAAAWLSTGPKPRLATAAGIAFLLGILIFSGSLYLLVLLDMGRLGAITPLGGVAFMVGWVLLALAGIGPRSTERRP